MGDCVRVRLDDRHFLIVHLPCTVVLFIVVCEVDAWITSCWNCSVKCDASTMRSIRVCLLFFHLFGVQCNFSYFVTNVAITLLMTLLIGKVIENKNSSRDEIVNVNLFTTILHMCLKIPKREPTSFSKFNDR